MIRRPMFYLIFACLASGFALLHASQIDQGDIRIINTGAPFLAKVTKYDAGPVVGDILNYHYFPGLIYYSRGRFTDAVNEFNYFLAHPEFSAINPRQAEFMTIAFYLRGSIYLRHATGIGRHALAKADFEAAIRWKRSNYLAYQGLSEMYVQLGYTDKAIAALRSFLDANPKSGYAAEAQQAIAKLENPAKGK